MCLGLSWYLASQEQIFQLEYCILLNFMLHSWPLSAKYTLLIIRENGSRIWVLTANQSQNRCITAVICITNDVINAYTESQYNYFNSTIIFNYHCWKKPIIGTLLFCIKYKRLILHSNNYDLKYPKYPFLSQSTAEWSMWFGLMLHVTFSLRKEMKKNLSYQGGDKTWPLWNSKWYYIKKTHEGTLINQQKEIEKLVKSGWHFNKQTKIG